MVVDRQQADQRQVDPAIDGFDRVVGRDFAAQMEPVLGPRHAPLAHRADRFDHACAVLDPVGVTADVAQRQRIEHRGDAGGGDLRVVRHDRRHSRPLDAWSRREVLFHVVGMQLDEPRHEIVALQVDGAGVAAALADIDDVAVAHHDGAVELGVGGDDAAVREDDLGTHACAPGKATLWVRVASTSRTARSWKMPTMAVPASRRWRIRSITPSRLATSSEAVGSSSSSTG
jgi:hypothetical protein